MLTLRTAPDSPDLSLAAARDLLVDPVRGDATFALLGSAALCAACALALAGSVVLGPPAWATPTGGPPAAPASSP